MYWVGSGALPLLDDRRLRADAKRSPSAAFGASNSATRVQVAAAVESPDGVLHYGVNVENAAYPQGVCAEGGALSMMISAGDRRVAEVLVIGEAAVGDAMVAAGILTAPVSPAPSFAGAVTGTGGIAGLGVGNSI